jgi:AcrR family transcriptional regulator
METTEVKFQRARNNEQKEIRMQQIMEATLDLYETHPYQKISLSTIAKKLNFTRANLYKYVHTKEEIFLYILIKEAEKFVEILKKKFPKNKTIEVEEFAQIWAETFDQNHRFIELMSIMYSIIQKNVSLSYLIEFKKKFSFFLIEAQSIVQNAFPSLSTEVVQKFLNMQMFYAMGLYPASIKSKLQKEAIEKSGIPYKTPNFKEEFSNFIVLIIKGLSS